MALRRLPSIATRSPALLSAPPRTMLLTRADVGRPMAGRRGLLDQGRRMAHYDPYAAQNDRVRATTILCVRKGGQAVMIGDGQVSQGNFVMKGNARKVKRLGADKHKVVAGMAGSTADAMALFERLEEKLEKYPGQLLRAAVELTKDWRRDKYLRNLEASMLVADSKMSIMITGNGDVIEPEGESSQNVISIGSGGLVARSAALALLDMDLTAEEIARKAMKIAGDTCVFTNHTHIVEVIKDEDQSG